MTSSYSPVLTTKAIKDETEQRILRDAHVCHLHTDINGLHTGITPCTTCTHPHGYCVINYKEALVVVHYEALILLNQTRASNTFMREHYLYRNSLLSLLSNQWERYELVFAGSCNASVNTRIAAFISPCEDV